MVIATTKKDDGVRGNITSFVKMMVMSNTSPRWHEIIISGRAAKKMHQPNNKSCSQYGESSFGVSHPHRCNAQGTGGEPRKEDYYLVRVLV